MLRKFEEFCQHWVRRILRNVIIGTDGDGFETLCDDTFIDNIYETKSNQTIIYPIFWSVIFSKSIIDSIHYKK